MYKCRKCGENLEAEIYDSHHPIIDGYVCKKCNIYYSVCKNIDPFKGERCHLLKGHNGCCVTNTAKWLAPRSLV